MTKQERLGKEPSGNIGKRRYPIISENSLIKSVGFARRCTAMGLESKIVPCLALLKIRVPATGIRMTVIGPHFYTEVLGKRYEVETKNEEQSEPKVLVKLKRF